MKKFYIVLAVFATALLSSCVQEKSFDNIVVGENEIAFVMQNASTRSAEDAKAAVTRGITIRMPSVQGQPLFLEETIENLNPAPATKGAPAYTATLGELYKTLGVNGIYEGGSFGTATFEGMDTELTNGGWRYHHNYDGTPWPGKTTPVDFYLWMPAAGEGVSNLSSANMKTSFSLESPMNGQNQADLIFGQTTLTKQEHDGYLPQGSPVTMYHAMTGIKFRNGHPNGTQTKTIITKVELIGLVKSGSCVVTFDDSHVATPAWTLGTDKSTAENPFYLTYDNPTYVAVNKENNPDGTITYGADSKYNNTSWTAAAADHNLNDEEGSLTFWFIPQEVPDDLILKVYFTVKTPDSPGGSTLPPHEIKLGELLNEKYQSVEANAGKNLIWEAGQLRTYSLKPYDVEVEIEDEMSEDGNTKSGLHVANTGNVDEYVRMLIMGNWYGWRSDQDPTTDEPSILVGYKYKGDEAELEGLTDAERNEKMKEMVPPWFREGQDTDGDKKPDTDIYGSFDSSFLRANLAGRDGQPGDWADASGGFYYTSPIGPGAGVGLDTEEIASATKDLFKTYTVDNVPTIYITKPGSLEREKAIGVHLVMEIVIQAIAVPTVTVGTETKNVWWLQAWYDATGVDKLSPDADRNSDYVAIWRAGSYGSSIYVGE